MSWHGTFVWYELMANDPDRAAAFYGEVLGWAAVDAGMPGTDYRMFQQGGANTGGLMSTMAGGPPPGWLGYVAVDDCDVAAQAALAAGATIHRGPFTIANVGRVAIFGDPQGALLAIIHPTPPEGSPQQGAPRAAWHDLRSTDGDAAWAFHAPLFRWEERRTMAMGPAGTYRIFGASGGDDLGGMMRASEPPMAAWLFYFPVDGLDAALERVAAAGGGIRHGAHQVPGGGWVAGCTDPEGAHFALFSPER